MCLQYLLFIYVTIHLFIYSHVLSVYVYMYTRMYQVPWPQLTMFMLN